MTPDDHLDPWTVAPGDVQRDPRTYLRVLWRWKLLFLAVAITVPVAAALLRSPAPDVYRASTVLKVQLVTIDTSQFSGSVTSSDTLASAARLITTTSMARQAAEFLKPRPASPRTLLGAVKAEPDIDSGFITITATAPTARRAADIANAFASAVVETRAENAVNELNRTIAGVKGQIARLDATDIVGRNQLSQQLQRLRALRAAQGSNAQVIEPAAAPAAPIPQSEGRTTLLSIVVGLLLAIGAVMAAEAADRRIRTPSELEDLTGLPLLSAIPSSAFRIGRSVRAEDAEAFHTLRGALTYFNVDRRTASIVITSAGQQDGKTTVAAQLAISSARAGKRVLLVDADLRRPDVGARLGIPLAPGLGAVLAGERRVDEIVVEYPIEDSPGAGRLLVLPAGPPPPNPSELLSSQNMRGLLARLEEQADLVILDTAAALAVADALPLLQAASGVVLVARMEQSTREGVRRLQRVIVNAGGQLLGVVATGATSGGGYSGYSYELYDRSRRNGGRRYRPSLPGRRRARAGSYPDKLS
jgi:capsular exopolysaccharide synthesis family protein